MLEKVGPIQRYAVRSDPKSVPSVGPLDADAYIAERVDGSTSEYQKWGNYFVGAQRFWLTVENCLGVAGALLAAVLTFIHNQEYGGWVVVIAIVSIAVGADTLAERYAQLVLGYREMPDRLIYIAARWRRVMAR